LVENHLLSAVCKLEGIFEGTLSLYLQEEEASRSARLEGSSEDEVGLCRQQLMVVWYKPWSKWWWDFANSVSHAQEEGQISTSCKKLSWAESDGAFPIWHVRQIGAMHALSMRHHQQKLWLQAKLRDYTWREIFLSLLHEEMASPTFSETLWHAYQCNPGSVDDLIC
jgi:hypothetical protein